VPYCIAQRAAPRAKASSAARQRIAASRQAASHRDAQTLRRAKLRVAARLFFRGWLAHLYAAAKYALARIMTLRSWLA